jgi:hypothetical protein
MIFMNTAIRTMILILLIQVSSFPQSTWQQSSYHDFKDGKFLDAGSNAYVSAKGRIQMITRWDFNNDGFLDLLIPASHSHTEKENTYIYLNNGFDIDTRSRIELPGAGSRDGLIIDLNKDGYNDLVVINHSDSHNPKPPSWIYWGSDSGFSPYNRSSLPSAQGTAIAAGDFNNDSWVDIAIGCQYYDGDDVDSPRKSFIYWNSPNGFTPENNLIISLKNVGANALAAADLDYDGIDDLIFLTKENTYLLLSSRKAFDDLKNAIEIDIIGNAVATGDINIDKLIDIAICSKKGVMVIKGEQSGIYDQQKAILLKVDNPSDVVLKDVNKDGLDDVIVANLANMGGASWTDSYVYYSDGKDFSSSKVLSLPTLGASGVSCGDLNNDGYPEIVFSNLRITNQQNLLSYIYWNDKGNFRFENHTQLPTQGSMANAIGDVNNDGLPDVVFFNDEGFFRDGPQLSYIYWGDGTRNYSTVNRLEFYSHQIFGFGHADLDDDDYADLILAQQNFVSKVPHRQSGLLIHWNNKVEFKNSTHLTMEFGYGGVRIADINKDGYLDILSGGRCIDLNYPDKQGFPIFWGSDKGYSFKNRSVLHFSGKSIRGQLLMDLNKDGWLDIAGQVEDGKIKIWWGNRNGFIDESFTEIDLGRKDHLMYIKGADLNNDGWLDLLLPYRGETDGRRTSSFIYYGSEKGFSNNNRSEIPSYVPYQNTFADINKDGWLDLFMTGYGGDGNGSPPSLLFWGSKDGLKIPPDEIETYGSSGSTILDYDGDGWLDILVVNHRRSGSYFESLPHQHTCPSFIYWGGPKGFTKEKRLELMAFGPSGLNLRDPGNSYDRGLYEDYISSVYIIPENELPSRIRWEAETPNGTQVHFQIRVVEDKEALEESEWIGPAGINSWYTNSGSIINNVNGKIIQYRARLITPNGAATPYLTEVEISFSKK